MDGVLQGIICFGQIRTSSGSCLSSICSFAQLFFFQTATQLLHLERWPPLGCKLSPHGPSSISKRDHLWPAVNRTCPQARRYEWLLEMCYRFSPFQVWKDEQSHLLKEAQGQPVTLAGDGRADSPSYCAKYSMYSLPDLENKLLPFEVVQVCRTEISCSNLSNRYCLLYNLYS